MLTQSAALPVDKKAWISRIVKGKSFIDIGGLWGTKNEMVTCAIAGGASRAVMADIAPLGHHLWRDFDAHTDSLGVSGYECLSVDITKENAREKIGKIDVVHCSGIIYHVPDPIGMLINLRSVTTETLILTSMVVPPVLSSGDKTVDLGESGALFIPGLSDDQRAAAAAHFDSVDVEVAGITKPFEEQWVSPEMRITFGPWWWLLTPSLLAKMLAAARFKVLDQGESWVGRSHSFLCEAV